MTAALAIGLAFLAAPEIAWRNADRALINRIVEQSHVETSLPRPSVWVYLQNVLESGWLWLLERLRGIGLPTSLQHWLRIFAEVAIEAAVLLVVLLVARYVYRHWRKRSPEAGSAVLKGDPAPARAGADRDHWRRELDRRLSTSDIRGALEALWWWLASTLSGSRVDPSWTNRELLTRVGRLDLLKLTRLLDRMRYGATVPSVDELIGLVQALEKEMA